MIVIASVTEASLVRVDSGNEPGTVQLSLGSQPWSELLECHARALAAALLHYADELERKK